MILQPLVRVDADFRLDEDVICGRCGYNLRGLKATGICVECTRPVNDSVLRPGGPRLRLCARLAFFAALISSALLLLSAAAIDAIPPPVQFGLAVGAMAAAVFSLVMGLVCFRGIRKSRRIEK